MKQAVVTLSGSVEPPLQKLAAGKAAKSVQGITKMIDAITVQPRPFQTERKTLRRQGREELPSKLVVSASQRGTRIHTSLTSRETGNT